MLPDVVVSFEGRPAFLDDFEVFEVESGAAFERDRIERARTRVEMYARWLSGAEVVEVSTQRVRIRSGIFDGREIPVDFIQDVLGCKVLFVRKSSDSLNICVEERVDVDAALLKGLKELYDVADVYVFQPSDLQDLVVGLYRGRRYLGMGLLKKVEDDRLAIETRAKNFDCVEFGELRFDGKKEYIVRLP